MPLSVTNTLRRESPFASRSFTSYFKYYHLVSVVVVVVVNMFSSVVIHASFPASNVMITGGGSSLSEEVHKALGQQFSISHFQNNIELIYQPVGSTLGLSNLLSISTTTPYDYAASESIPSNEQFSQNPGTQVLPFVGTNILVIYNLPELSSNDPQLILDRTLLVNIFAGKITNWNDPSIAALNPSIASRLPNTPIQRVVRSDSSGTTHIFTSALTAFAADSKGETTWYLGDTSLPSEWPNESPSSISKQKGSVGVSNYVILTPYTIAYQTPDTLYEHTYAKIINAAGNAVSPTTKSCQNAMDDFKDAFDSKFTANIVNAKGAESYPISGYSYIVYKSSSMPDCNVGKVLYRYFVYLYSSASEETITEAKFVPLSSSIRNRIVNDYLSKWVCASTESVVTIDFDLSAPIALAVVGGIVALTCLGIVLGVSIYARIRKRAMIGDLLVDEEEEPKGNVANKN